MPATRAPSLVAASIATSAPMLWPARDKLSSPSASANRIVQSAKSEIRVRADPADRPWPGKSGASARAPPEASAASCARQARWSIPAPCRRRIVGAPARSGSPAARKAAAPSMVKNRSESCGAKVTGNTKKRRAATLAALSFSKPRPVQLADGATLGRAAAQVKAESGTKAARFRQKNGCTPFRSGNKQKAAVPKGGGSSLNREASRMIGEPIRERQHATPFPRTNMTPTD